MNDGPSLALVVLHSRDLEAARNFYSSLGLAFVPEQHGNGPRHYAATLGEVVVEIYPAANPSTPLRLGFRIASVDGTLGLLRNQGVDIIRDAQDSPWGRRAVVADPDGNRVELTETTAQR